jgi:hypothetical protein
MVGAVPISAYSTEKNGTEMSALTKYQNTYNIKHQYT